MHHLLSQLTIDPVKRRIRIATSDEGEDVWLRVSTSTTDHRTTGVYGYIGDRKGKWETRTRHWDEAYLRVYEAYAPRSNQALIKTISPIIFGPQQQHQQEDNDEDKGERKEAEDLDDDDRAASSSSDAASDSNPPSAREVLFCFLSTLLKADDVDAVKSLHNSCYETLLANFDVHKYIFVEEFEEDVKKAMLSENSVNGAVSWLLGCMGIVSPS